MKRCRGDGYTLWTLTGSGTLENPDELYSQAVPGVAIGHSATFTWDGEVFVFGHEPGGPFCSGLGCEIGGVWSTYWYNNFMYETNINEGLNIFRLSDRVTAGAMRLDHLNPQTQEFTID